MWQEAVCGEESCDRRPCDEEMCGRRQCVARSRTTEDRVMRRCVAGGSVWRGVVRQKTV